MWVFEEMVNGRKLTEIINTEHENVKYLPGHKLPSNVVSNSLCLFITTILKLSDILRMCKCSFCLFVLFLI